MNGGRVRGIQFLQIIFIGTGPERHFQCTGGAEASSNSTGDSGASQSGHFKRRVVRALSCLDRA